MPSRRTASLAAALGSVSLLALGAGAATSAPPAQAAGFSVLSKIEYFQGTSANARTPNYASWYSKDITHEHFSAPTIADLDGDGVPDIVAGFPDGTVQVWRTDNGQRWLTVKIGNGAVQGSPTVVDLLGNGQLKVLAADTVGNVVAFDARGRTLFRTRTGDGVHPPGNFASPVAADINKDGRLDIIEPSWDHHLHVWDVRSNKELPGFPVFLADTSWSSPAIADLDNDGWPEIVFGYDCDGVEGQPCYPKNKGGYLAVLRHDGTRQPGFPRLISNQVVWSSPAIGDIDGDGKLDIVVGTGSMPAPHMPAGQYVYAFRNTGAAMAGWPVKVGGRVMSSPALGDITGDGKIDVAAVADNGRLYVINGKGQVQFSTCLANDLTSCPKGLHSSPSIADVDGTGKFAAIVGGEQWVDVVGAGGAVRYRGETISGTYPVTGTPAVAQIDGKTWIVAVSSFKDASGEYGRVFAWTTNKASSTVQPWPQFHRDAQHLGTLPAGGR